MSVPGQSDLPGRLITLFHFLRDPLINILNESTHISDPNSGIVKPSKAWMVCQRSIKSEHLFRYAEVNAMTWAPIFTLFHFLIDLLINILSKCTNTVDLKY